jgi:hypothetical protein
MCAKSSATPQASNETNRHANHCECSLTVATLHGANPHIGNLSLAEVIQHNVIAIEVLLGNNVLEVLLALCRRSYT